MNSKHHQPPTAETNNSEPNDADRLRELLAKAGLSQRAAARELGVDERTMRYWCAGEHTPPPMAFRALEPRIRHRINLLRSILDMQQQIEMLESGQMTLARGAKLGDASSAAVEARSLRQKIEELRSLLRQDVAFERRQAALFAVNGQFLPHGSGLPTEESLAEFEAAEAEWREATEEVDRIVREIHAGLR
jgi:DNA-binding transcriptional regulator YiaG